MKLEIHVITDGNQEIEQLAKQIFFIHEEADYIHIRERTKTASELIDLVSILLNRGVPRNKLVINDRLDVALLTDIPNVQLPGHGFSIQDVKRFNSRLRVGRSVHSLQEAIKCEQEGADYLLYGHVFSSQSKPGLEPRGIKQLTEICRNIRIPVIAIGGIVPGTISQLSGAKISGIAVMSYVMGSENPSCSMRMLKESLAKVGNNENTL